MAVDEARSGGIQSGKFTRDWMLEEQRSPRTSSGHPPPATPHQIEVLVGERLRVDDALDKDKGAGRLRPGN